LLFQVATTLIIVSKPVLSHFSSTVFALSWVNADVLSSHHADLSSSEVENASISQINSFTGLRVNQVDFHFIILLLALADSHC